MSDVRALLEKMPNKELFSDEVNAVLGQAVEPKIQSWRLQTDVTGRAERLQDIRRAAPDYVAAFMSVQAGTAIIDQLLQNYGLYDMNELEEQLKRQIESWIQDVDDRLIQQYDVVSVQELVFAQLRSWC